MEKHKQAIRSDVVLKFVYNSQPVFYSIHVRKLAKFVIWDVITGSVLFLSMKTVQDSTLIAFGASTIAVEGVNQFLKRTSAGKRLIKDVY